MSELRVAPGLADLGESCPMCGHKLKPGRWRLMVQMPGEPAFEWVRHAGGVVIPIRWKREARKRLAEARRMHADEPAVWWIERAASRF